MTGTFNFCGQLHPNSRKFHDTIAASYLSADGWNDSETAREFLVNASDEQLAAEAEKDWELDGRADYNRLELIAAFNRLRITLYPALGQCLPR